MAHFSQSRPWSMLKSPRLCSVRSLAVGRVLAARLDDPQCAPNPICAETEAVSRLQQLDEIDNNLLGPIDPKLDSIPLFVNQTRLAVMSEDCSLHQHLARIYRELAEIVCKYSDSARRLNCESQKVMTPTLLWVAMSMLRRSWQALLRYLIPIMTRFPRQTVCS